MNGEGGLLKTQQAVSYLNVHPHSLKRWADAGQLTRIRLPGGGRRWRSVVIERIIQGRRAESREETPGQ